MTKRSIASAATLLAVLSWPAPGAAQDAHYWTYGYGPVGQLTEGTIVGGVHDLSAVYYNPGALALLDQPRFVINLTSVELANIDVPDAAGENLDFEQVVFDLVPAMVAFQVGGSPGDRRPVRGRDALPPRLGLGPRLRRLRRHGQPDRLRRLRPLPPARAGVLGRGHLVAPPGRPALDRPLAFRRLPRPAQPERARPRRSSRAGTVGSIFVARENEYNHVRVLAKAGLAWRPGRWELGATVTAPGFRVWSNGKSVWNASVAGIESAPILSASRQDGLQSTYNAPWSVAGGATWRSDGTAVHSSVEWFSSVDAYDILELEPAPVAGSSTTIPLTFRGEAASVFNYGLGLEQRLGERVVALRGRGAQPVGPRSRAGHVRRVGPHRRDGGLHPRRRAGEDRLRGGLRVGQRRGGAGHRPPRRRRAPRGAADFSRWTFSLGASFGAR